MTFSSISISVKPDWGVGVASKRSIILEIAECLSEIHGPRLYPGMVKIRKTFTSLQIMSGLMPITRVDPGTYMDYHILSTILDSIPKS